MGRYPKDGGSYFKPLLGFHILAQGIPLDFGPFQHCRSHQDEKMSGQDLSQPILPTSSRVMSLTTDPAVPQEPSLLREPQLAAWAGFRVGMSQAISIEMGRHHGEHAALAMILKGRTRGRIRSRGEECDFSPGPNSVGLFAPKFDVSWTRWQCEPGAERFVVELDFADLHQAGDLEQMLTSRRTLRQNLTLSDPQLASLMRLIANEVRGGSPHGALYATSLSISLAAYLCAQYASGGRTPTRERGVLTAIQKQHVLELVQRRLHENLSLDELAAAAGASRFHFLRLFKNSLGMTPYQFVMDQRIAAARQLLEKTSRPLVDVAAATGFSSQSHMSTVMKRHTGLSPGHWRRSRPK
jgi:AraC family transcriptional regulator